MRNAPPHHHPSLDRVAHLPPYASNIEIDAARDNIAVLASEHASHHNDPSRGTTIYLDISDLIEYLKRNDTVSGIQRVVANLIEHAPDVGRLHDADVVFVFPEYNRNRIYAVDRDCVKAMLAAIEGAGRSRVALELAISEVYESREFVTPSRGDIFTIAGAFWTYDNYDLLMRLREHGVGVVNFIHDLIQISNPEFVFEAATRQFRRALVDILSSSTGLLTNSEYVAQDLRRFIGTRTDVAVPVRAVPLATELPPPDNEVISISPEIAEILKTDYVLSVSTIEVRKNHSFIVRLWELLMDEPVGDLPYLVFVGKLGWDIHPLLEYLDKTQNLKGKVKILNRVSDAELRELYRGAQFTMYMSFAEGFGLPVAESLAYGVPCISSNRSSMPEVGGRFARYLDPDDIAAGVALVRELIEDKAALADWRKDIATNFRARTWRQFSKDYIAGLLAFAEPDGRCYNNRFRAGELYGMGAWEVARRDANGEDLTYLVSARSYGWHDNEDWGCWAASRKAGITLATDLDPGGRATIYLLLRAPGQHHAINFQIMQGDETVDMGTVGASETWRNLDCQVGEDGVVKLDFVTKSAKPEVGDVRDLYVGLIGIAFCRHDDIAQRLKIIEAIALNPGRMGPPLPLARPKDQVNIFTSASKVDADWYLERHPDVRLLGLTADQHYEWIGKRLGRKPNAKYLPRVTAEAP